MIKIDKDIPIPEKGQFKYPYTRLKVGESFAVAASDRPTTVASAVQAWGRRHRRRFIFRQHGPKKVMRCWRTR